MQPNAGFVTTPEVESLTRRALAYLRAGYPVHFAGPPGVGKTSLAFHTAARLARPVVLLHGDDEVVGSDLTGRYNGYRRYKVVDNFIHTVSKTEEETRNVWVDNRLTLACQQGYTLIYDEFNRSRPETNNTLLSVLSEGLLSLTRQHNDRGYVEVNPSFRAIFTSNPEEYAGVHKTQDALLDRLITLTVGHYDRDTELSIVAARTGVPQRAAAVITDVVHALREHAGSGTRPTLRAGIAIGRVVQTTGAEVHLADDGFRWACRDILGRDVARGQSPGIPSCIDEIVERVCHAHGALGPGWSLGH